MASRLEQDLSCPVCCELFKDPVLLSCSHSFCKVCLENWWRDKRVKTCPVCKRPCKRKNCDRIPLNLALRNLVETYSEEREQRAAQPECRVHSEKLRLFCVDHQEPVCLVCRDSRTHTDHSFRPIQEAAEDLRKQLGSSIRPLQDKLKVLAQYRAQLDSAVAHIKAQAQHTHSQITDQFEKLHKFLREEEDSRIKALNEEKEQKTEMMGDILAAVSRDMEALSRTISETEEQLRAADISFLLQYKTAAERALRCHLVEEPKMEPGALIDQAKHLGNLGFNIWRNMKSLVHFYPVILDPNTADPRLVLSKHLSSVREGQEQKVPQNPERNEYYCVDGSKEFVSGTHSWDVEVGGSNQWAVGVRSVQRAEEARGGLWCICFVDGEYLVDSPPATVKPLSVQNLQRVRVKLDFNSKTVTFTDPNTNTELHTFTDTFTEELPLTPYFFPGKNVALKILPKNITVTV